MIFDIDLSWFNAVPTFESNCFSSVEKKAHITEKLWAENTQSSNRSNNIYQELCVTKDYEISNNEKLMDFGTY